MQTPNIDETQPASLDKETGREETSPIANNNSLQDTHPIPVHNALSSETQSADLPPDGGDDSTASGSPRSAWRPLALVAILTLLIIAAMSCYGGYRAGLNDRTSKNSAEAAAQLAEQYQLALQNIDNQQLDLAQQRLVYIINQDPNFPGAQDKLTEVLLQLNTTATATLAPTPTLTPTPDLRSVDELFTQAKQAIAGGDWSAAIEDLLKLRKNQPDYHAIEVDDMLYLALVNRGIDKIKNADLEGGTYDLSLAERFGPLPVEAKNWRDWAELYITGASFWDVDWAQVISYFQQLDQIAPYMMDGSGWTSTERLRIAYIKYGDQLATAGDWCKAQEQYKAAIDMPGGAPTVEPTATFADEKCHPPTEVPTITPTPTATSTGEAVVTPPPSGETPAPTSPPQEQIPTTPPPAAPSETPAPTTGP